MKDFISRISSRKFLLALGTAITAFSQRQYAVAGVAVIGYLASEGIVDYRSVSAAQQIESRAHDLAVQILSQLKTQEQSMADHPSAGRRSGDRPARTRAKR